MIKLRSSKTANGFLQVPQWPIWLQSFFQEPEKLEFSSVGPFFLFCLFDDRNRLCFEMHSEDEFYVY